MHEFTTSSTEAHDALAAEAARLRDAADKLASVANHMLHAPAGAKVRPLPNDLQQALEDYRTVRYSGMGQSVPVPFNAITEKIERLGYILMRLVGDLGFQAQLTAYGGDFELHGVDRDARINVLRETFSNVHVEALTEFASRHGLELEWSTDHGVTLRLRPDWFELPISAEESPQD